MSGSVHWFYCWHQQDAYWSRARFKDKTLNQNSPIFTLPGTVYEGLHEEYYSFTTPEAAKAIDTYLEYRVRQGEKISQDAPLFRQQFDVRDMDIVKNPKSMDKRVLADLIRQKIHRSGLMSITPLTAENKPGKKRNPIKRAHGFRKFVTTTMINAGVNETVVDKLTGHSTGNRLAYYKPQSVDLLGEFLKAVDALTINEENRLRMKVQQLTIDVSEIAQFKKELDDLKELVRRS